jgi:nucleotide-binding universal stress UspA family protein
MKILVAADISPTAIAIVEFLQAWLQDNPGRPQITILHVTEPELSYSETLSTSPTASTATCEAELREIFHPLEANAEIRYVLTNEGFGDSILRRAQTSNLIVMGRRKRGSLQEMVLGSLSQYILHRAPCPVVMVPEPTSRQIAQKVLKLDSTPQSTLSPEAFARLKVLIYVAKADGILDELEKARLISSVQLEEMPEGVTWDQLFTDPIHLEQELHLITSPEAQALTYYVAYSLVNANPQGEEQTAIATILSHFNFDPDKVQQLNALVHQSYSIQGNGKVQAIENAEQRSTVVEQKILHSAIATSVLGSFPSPLSSTYTQSAALGLQMTLIADIAGLWGCPNFRAKPLMEAMVGSLGLVSAWLIAVDVAKLVPKVGSDLAAVDAFLATWGIGKAAHLYFEAEQDLKPAKLRQSFRRFRKMGEAPYHRYEKAITEQQQMYTESIRDLTEELKAGKLTPERYQHKIQRLLVSVSR